jgi:DNA polymerase I-like protein with 3'-5' exonuclease and polymerase domains
MQIVVGDIETDGLKGQVTKLHSFQMAERNQETGEAESKVIVLNHNLLENFERSSEVQNLLDLGLWFHNAPFDVAVLRLFGYRVDKYYDSMLLSNCYHANVAPVKGSKHSLAACGSRVGEEKAEYKGDWDEWNEEMEVYARQDVVTTLAVVEDLLPKMMEDAAAWNHFINIEMPYCEVVMTLDAVGFPVIPDKVLAAIPTLQGIVEDRLAKCREIVPLLPQGTIKKLVGEKPTGTAKGDHYFLGMEENTGKFMYKVWDDFKPSSSQQVAEAIAQTYGWQPNTKTKKGNVSVTEEVLSELDYPLAKLVIEYTGAQKVFGTFLKAAVNNTSPDNRLRTSWNNALTLTGRLSTSAPFNAQNLPADADDEVSNVIRGFIGVEGERRLVSADLQAVEYRMLTSLMMVSFLKYDGVIPGDVQYMADVFIQGKDIHTAMADLWLPEEPDRKVARKLGKNISYGRMFGIAAQKASGMMGVSEKEAQRLLDLADVNNPSFNIFHDRVLQEMRDAGGVGHTLYGRRLVYPDLLSKNKWGRLRAERQAFNSVVQGSAADLLKIIQLLVVPVLPEGSLFCASVHDELLVECIDMEQALVVQSLLETAFASKLLPFLPCAGNAKIGQTWLEIH